MCFNTTTCKKIFQKEKKTTTTCTGTPGKRGRGGLIIFFTLSKHMYLQNRAFKSAMMDIEKGFKTISYETN